MTHDRTAPLLIRLTRTSASRHRLDLTRADGTRESLDLETRSCLLHDLVHFAVETEAGLTNGFFGHLARGVRYETLVHEPQAPHAAAELWLVERVVGPLQGAWRSTRLDPAAFVAAFRSYQESLGEACPAWLDAGLIERAADRLRRLEGEWRATKFGMTMELRFPGN